MDNFEIVLLIVSFLDLFGVSMLVTCLPSHLAKLDVSGFNLGIFLSLYGAIQLFSSSFMGYIGDVYGKRFVLKVCALFSAIGYFCMALAPSFQCLIAARLIVAIFKHTLTLTSAVLSTHTSSSSRDRIIGFFTSMSSLGFLFGPPLGGWLYDNFGFQVVANTCGVSFISIFGLLMLATSSQPSPPLRERSRQHASSALGWRQILTLWDLYALQFLMGASVLIFRTNFSTVMKGRFDAPVLVTGLIISSGSLSGVIGGAFSDHVVRLYNKSYSRVVLHACVVRTLSMLGCTLAPSLSIFVVMQLPLSFSNTACREAILSLIISRVVNPADCGKVLGFSQSLLSFARLVTPFFGSIAMEWDYRAPALMGTILAFISSVICLRTFSVEPRRRRSHAD